MTTASSPQKTAQLAPKTVSRSPASIRAQRAQRRRTLLVVGGRIAFFILLVLAWQIASQIVGPLFICSPLAVFLQLKDWTLDGTLWYNTQVTLEETLLGLLYGVAAGIVAGFLLGLQPILGKILDPFIVALYSIPKVALAPLFILWFGFELEMKVIVAAVTVFFLVFFNTLTGVRNVDQNLIDAVRLMGAKRRDIMLKVIIPSTTGYVLTGLHMAIPYALVGAVVGEVISVNRGLGYLLNNSASEFSSSGVFAALFMITVIAGLLNAVVDVIDRRTSRWKAGMHATSKIIPM